MPYKTIVFEKEEGVATLTLNREKDLNALNLQMFEEIEKAIEDVAKDSGVRALIITGAGRAFCSGVDITFLNNISGISLSEFRVMLAGFQEVFNKIEELEKPVIAAINGFALGAGCDFALACDIRIASDRAQIGELYVKVGLIPDMGGTQRLPKLVGVGKAKELIFSGDMIDANEAEKIGLVNKVTPADELQAETKKMALKLAKGPSVAIGLAKRAINKGLGTDPKSGLVYEIYGQSLCLQTEDHKEAVKAFIEKREPDFKGR